MRERREDRPGGRGPTLRLLVLANAAVGHTHRWVDYFVDRGDEVHLASLETPGPTRAVSHRLPRLAPLGAVKYPLTVPWARRLARGIEPDLVVAHFVPNYGFLAALTDRRPFAVVMWGSDLLINPERSRFHRWRARRTLEAADLVLSDAAVLTRSLETRGIHPRRVETLTFGVDTDRFRPLEKTGTGRPIILSCRRLEPLYNVELLVRAVPGIAERTAEPFEVQIIGDGSERERLRRLARDLGVAEHVSFPGRLDDNALIEAMGVATAYVSTSISDSTSVSLLEAMASGAAPVVSDIEGNREWVRHGENGFLVPLDRPDRLAESIVDVLGSPTLRARFVEHNLRLVRSRGDWAKNMERTRTLLRDLVRGR